MTSYSEELFDKICDRIACGESVNEICKDDDMPHRDSFYRWMRNDETKKLYDKYARAKSDQMDYYAEEMIEIADDVSRDLVLDGDGKPVIDGFAAQRAKIMIDTRKWLMGKLKPKKYGDKQEVDVTSSDGSMSPDAATRNAVLERLKKKHEAGT